MKKKQTLKREGPIKIPLPFEEAVSDFLKVKPDPKRSKKRIEKR
jgi:hypothetical protein